MSYRSKTQTFFYKFFIWPLEAIILYFIYYLITALPFKISSLIMGNFFRFLGPLLSWNKRADNQLRFAIPKLSLKQMEEKLINLVKNSIKKKYGNI